MRDTEPCSASGRGWGAWPRFTVLGAALFLAGPASTGAQTVRGVLRDGSTGEAISAALVHLEYPDGERVGSVLTDPGGRFTFRPGVPGRFKLVAQHIGHATVTTDPFDLGIGATRSLELTAGPSPIRIRGVTANPDRLCRTLDEDDAEIVGGFWEEASKALEAARWTAEEAGLSYEVTHFTRTRDPDSFEIRDEASQTRTGTGANPFHSLRAEVLAEEGYVQGDDASGRDYFAPDADVLLSPTFVNTHCFRLSHLSDEADSIGIEFEPSVEGDVPDIEGAAWLDGASLKLRRIEFRYTRLDIGVSTDELGGEVSFEELVTGAWIVGEWAIRMPQIYQYRMRSRRLHRDLIGIREVGGVVSTVTDPEGRSLRVETR